MSDRSTAELIVIGGGVVGAAIAYGATRRGCPTIVLDEGDVAFRAARGNFGLVWVQGKGATSPPYAAWSRRSSELWPDFCRRLEEKAADNLQYVRNGGLHLCVDADELAQVAANMERVREASALPYPYEVLDNTALRALEPAIGREVVGGIYCPLDGHVSPLALLRALFTATTNAGGRIVANAGVTSITRSGGTFRIESEAGRFTAKRIVLAAGLGNARLAPMVGLSAPVKPIRGQVMVTERLRPFLGLPSLHVRQTGDGSVQIGDSKEDVGFDEGTTLDQLRRIATRAVRCFPVLAGVNMIRSWGALRVMTPDGLPIYRESASCPGAFVATCHSGITLAAVHAEEIADWIAGFAPAPAGIETFDDRRFDVQAH